MFVRSTANFFAKYGTFFVNHVWSGKFNVVKWLNVLFSALAATDPDGSRDLDNVDETTALVEDWVAKTLAFMSEGKWKKKNFFFVWRYSDLPSISSIVFKPYFVLLGLHRITGVWLIIDCFFTVFCCIRPAQNYTGFWLVMTGSDN